MMVIDSTNPIKIQRIKDMNTASPMWVSDNIIYNSAGDTIGKINKNTNKMKLFIIN
jgi:hypothetical protein